jgi:thioredoxin reductase
LVLDTGQPRNRTAAISHGFLGRDGFSPERIQAEARSQLLVYPGMCWKEDRAVEAERSNAGDFVVCTLSGASYRAWRLVLAYGVRDELPPIEGLEARWGRSVFYCPYCHAYETDRGAIGVLASEGPRSIEQALLLTDWGRVTLFLNQDDEPSQADVSRMAERGIALSACRLPESATRQPWCWRTGDANPCERCSYPPKPGPHLRLRNSSGAASWI